MEKLNKIEVLIVDNNIKIIEKTDKFYPKRLLEIKKSPPKLYVKGNEKLLNNKSLAIVGARKCTQYGIKYTKKFAKEIAQENITIVSGLALGIDSIAHEYSKEYIGSTIAVLGCGVNKIYPIENTELYKQILENNGCIVSEYEPDEEVDMSNFPKRNRIISGIASGVLVIEAEYRSGSGITGKYGLEQDKKVFCLPRNIDVTNGVGTNNLIKKGAILVTDSKEIIKELKEPEINVNIKKKNNKKSKKVNTNTKIIKQTNKDKEKVNKIKEAELQIPEECRQIYNLILYSPTNIQKIANNSGLPISEINEKLILLELEGYIKGLPGNSYVRSTNV